MNPTLIAAPSALLAAAAGLTSYGAVYPRSELFGSMICRTNSPNKLAITFDDGPNPAITPKLLELLQRRNARATFFLIGRFASQCPDLVREIAARGHLLGNHTDSHPNLFWLTPQKVHEELQRCNDVISSIVGASPKWFRPPFGLRNPWVVPIAGKLGQRAVMWTQIPGDWKVKPTEWLIHRMESVAVHAQKNSVPKAQPHPHGTGDILCLHDGNHRHQNGDRARTIAALEHWLPRWRDVGLEFVTIDEAVRSPAT